MVDKRLIAGMSLSAFLAIAATLIATTPIQNIYYCEPRDLVQYCESLSATNKTCYFKDDAGKSSSKICTIPWNSITKYINITQTKPNNVTDDETLIIQGQTCFLCDNEIINKIQTNMYPKSTIDDVRAKVKSVMITYHTGGIVDIRYDINGTILTVLGYGGNLMKSPVSVV